MAPTTPATVPVLLELSLSCASATPIPVVVVLVVAVPPFVVEGLVVGMLLEEGVLLEEIAVLGVGGVVVIVLVLELLASGEVIMDGSVGTLV